MNKLLLGLLLVCVICICESKHHPGKKETVATETESLESLFSKFGEWKSKHAKNYISSEEELYRFNIWVESKKRVESNDDPEVKLSLNKFSDLTRQEFRELYLMRHVPIPEQPIGEEFVPETTIEHIQNTDWKAKGKTPPVTNQGSCGSCWAFGAMVQYNSAVAIKTGTVGNYSEQQLVSCSADYGNGGCGGGWPLNGLKYVQDKGVCTNAAYPYTSGKSRDAGRCNTAKAAACKGKNPAITRLVNVPKGKCDALAVAVASGPVIVAVDADKFGDYDSGIFSSCGTQINHAVTVVGFVKNSHWIIQNSWGPDWGEDGFMRVKFGNTCAICEYGQYATV